MDNKKTATREQVTVRMPTELLAALRSEAGRLGLNTNQFVNIVLRQWVAEFVREPSQTRKRGLE